MLIFTQKYKTDIREIIVEYFSTNELQSSSRNTKYKGRIIILT